MRKKLFVGLLAFLVLLGVALVGGSRYMLSYSLQPKALAESRDMQSSFLRAFENYPFLMEWVDSLTEAEGLGDLYIENEEGLNLHALCIPAARPTRKTAVLVHGYTDNAVSMLQIAYLYNHEMGFNVLLPDLHGHGLSEGDAIQMGWKDRLDLLLWTEKADELFGRNNEEVTVDGAVYLRSTGTEMVVHGVSMGAATTMMMSGEVEQGLWQQPYVKCFVEDCGYTSVWDEFKSELQARFSLPAFPLMHLTDNLCQRLYGWGFREASALEAVKRSTRPMLFIHGDADDFVPTEMVYSLYEAKPEPKELWVLPGVGHADAYKHNPAAYTQRIKEFVGKYIAPASDPSL